MKKLFTVLAVLLVNTMLFAITPPVPEKMSYQAVIRDMSNNLVVNHAVGMKTSILQGSVTGTAVYVEIYNPNYITNANGLVTVEIGGGIPLTGTFSTINWTIGPYFIKTETDPTGGTNYTTIGISQLLSVPYALYAKTADTITGTITETDPIFNAWTKSYTDLTNKPNLTVYATKNMNNQNIINLANPVNAQDAATKNYVDQKLQLLTAALQGVQDADGNHYATVMIGDQVWMVENLKTTKYNDGTSIPLISSQSTWTNLTTPGYCWYNNDVANKSVYGGFYNGYAVLTGNLCPAGWHVPTISEFIVLKNYLIVNGYNYDGSTSGNKIAKSLAATVRWTASTYAGSPGNVPAANNSSGFSGLPGGLRAYSGIFYYIGNEGYWWSSSISGSYGNIVSLSYSSVGIVEPSGPAKSGVCVRCLKN